MGKLIDLTGQRFGFWVAQEIGSKNLSGQTQWLCLCECGTKKMVTSNSLRRGNSTSCGCNHAPDLTNEIFGKLMVIGIDDTTDKSRRFWSCQCSCGDVISVSTYRLREGLVESCGCNLQDKIKSTLNNTKKLSRLIDSITVSFESTEDIITGSKKLSNFMSSVIAQKEFTELKKQILQIMIINESLQKDIIFLSNFKSNK